MSLYGNIYDRSVRNKKKYVKFSINTLPYFYSISLVIWPLTLIKRIHFSELSISRFSTYIREALIPYSGRKYSHTNSSISAMIIALLRKMVISQLELGPPVEKMATWCFVRIDSRLITFLLQIITVYRIIFTRNSFEKVLSKFSRKTN